MNQSLEISKGRLTSFKLLAVIAFTLNILLVIIQIDGLRTDQSVVEGLALIVLMLVGLVSWWFRDGYKLNFGLLLVSATFVSGLSAFVFELTSPIMALNVVVVAAAALALRPMHAALVSLLVINGPIYGYIFADNQSSSEFVLLLTHALALGSLLVAGLLYSHQRNEANQITQSITDEQNTERKRLEALINSMTDGVVATDVDGVVTIYNGSALDILNLNASLDGQMITDFMNVIDQREEPVDLVQAANKNGGYLVSRDLRLVLDEHDKMNLFVNISPVKVGFGEGGGAGLIMLLRDITREKSLEEERNEFISVVSHELRTPITITEGNVSNALMVAEKEQASDMMQNMLKDAHKQVVFLADMMNDLSTLSRAERGKLQVQPEDIDVNELVSSLQRDYKASAEHKGLKLLTHIDKEVGTIFNSRLYVREVLQNFLTNSIKYTQEGEVKISTHQDGSTAVFAVSDTGIGISKSDQKMLFDKFFRSEDYRTRENSGTGLGLYVTMKLTKLINAKIDVDSELNKGSTFTVTIPSFDKDKPPKGDQESTVS